jgi:hypothetical protein
MRLMVRLGQGGQRVWTVVQSGVALADGIRGYPDVEGCYGAAVQLVEADNMLAIQDSDGRWEWIAYGLDGTPTAHSPRTYDNAADCGSALREVRGVLASART